MIEQQEYINKLHQEILVIMDEIHRVCVENGLTYYLIGGTLLGAVRHKGFIPWDDDLDIAMPRKDWNRFIKLANTKLCDQFYLNWITTNKNYWNLYPKVCLKNTLYDEGKYRNAHNMGIFVDIFPIDIVPGYSQKLEKTKQQLKRWHYISSARNSKYLSLKNMLYKFLSLFISNVFSYKRQYEVCVKTSQQGGEYYANFCSQYNLIKQTMPIKWYGEGELMKFEGRRYYGPKEYTKVLSSIFGPDYMQLPPVEKRRCHYPELIRFSDGIEIRCDAPIHRISIKEQ